mmetsp:Transcript_41631/g.126229  ORF Transcript_41631/g.126229 Transcript_41631/m.126229 type:complete len:490 (-) Transcript_41631:151-1620(-)
MLPVRSFLLSDGWYDASTIMVHRAKQEKSPFNVWSFLNPFETGVWVLIGATIVFSGFSYWLLASMNSRADERRLSNWPLDSIFLSALTFTGHFEFRPNTLTARLMSFSWTFWALIMASAYTANLASFLVTRNTHRFGVSSIEEAIQTQSPVCIFARSREDDFMTKNYPKVNLIRKEQEKDVFLGLKTDECQGVITQMSSFEMFERNKEVNDDCGMKWTGRTIQFGPSGFATHVDTGTYCTSLLSYVVNLHMVRMKAEGFVEKAWNTHVLDKISDRRCVEVARGTNDSGTADGDDSVKLSIKDVGGIFVFHVSVCVASLLIAAFQRSSKRTKKKSTQRREATQATSQKEEEPEDWSEHCINRRRKQASRGSTDGTQIISSEGRDPEQGPSRFLGRGNKRGSMWASTASLGQRLQEAAPAITPKDDNSEDRPEHCANCRAKEVPQIPPDSNETLSSEEGKSEQAPLTNGIYGRVFRRGDNKGSMWDNTTEP